MVNFFRILFPTDGKNTYRVIGFILIAIYGLFTLPVLQEFENIFLLCALPVIMWLIYKLYSKAN